MPTVVRRCFRYTDLPKHDKFWTIQVVGTQYFVTYGKVGSNGATQIKQFGSTSACNEAARKIVQEKRGKGYREVGSDDHPGAPQSQIDLVVRSIEGGPPPAPAVREEVSAPRRPPTPAGYRHLEL